MAEDKLKEIDQLLLSNAFNAAVEILEHFGTEIIHEDLI